MSAIDRDYDNATNRGQILETLDDESTDAGEGELPGEDATPDELNEARETVAAERQPDASHLPGTESQTAEWRGTPLEFDEFGGLEDKLTGLIDDPDVNDSDAREWLNEELGEKCQDPAANADYWARFDLMRGDDTDGLMDLVKRIVGEPSEEDLDRAEKFRN